MRVLFSSTRGAGHLQPLLPYAHALEAHGHEVKIAGPVDIAETLNAAGLAHAPFDHPGDATLAPIWARFRGASPDEALALAIREIFAGLNSKAALPKLMETIDTWRPDLVVRDSVEFASAVAAERAVVPHARVAVHTVSFEEIIPGGPPRRAPARCRPAAQRDLVPERGAGVQRLPGVAGRGFARNRPAASSRSHGRRHLACRAGHLGAAG